MNDPSSQIFFIMGVSGAGKTTIGKLLAQKLVIPFFDADDFHPIKNIKKMAGGNSLNDDDRQEWLRSLNQLAKREASKSGGVIACSALKQSYRTILEKGLGSSVQWIFLEGSFELISERLNKRKGHYMPANLLQSQFDTLEIPDAVTFNIDNTPEIIVDMIIQNLYEKADFGLIGLGEMARSLCRNMGSKEIKVSMYNNHVSDLEENIAGKFQKEYKELKTALVFDQLHCFVASLESPRKIFLMESTGSAMDAIIKELTPLLSHNDIIIDAGDSHYDETTKRAEILNEKGVFFLGTGVSAEKDSALIGFSIMPGGDKMAYELTKPFLQKIAAKDKEGNPCCTYIGPSGSGHFTKMVHNGIEYAEMQLLPELYQIFKANGRNPGEIAEILSNTHHDLRSYLLEITITILQKKEGNACPPTKVPGKAGNIGTGNYPTIASAQLGVPSTLISNALFAQCLSSFKEDGIQGEKNLPQEIKAVDQPVDQILAAYHLARIVNHIQGFNLLREASARYKWSLNLSEIARIWTNGCIIRSSLMEKLVDILKSDALLPLHPEISNEIKQLKPALSKVVSRSIESNLAVPCLSAAINYLNATEMAASTTNLIQAQRDYCGVRTYKREND